MTWWSDRFVRELRGTGIRVKMKPRSTAVEGGAGSTSQRVSANKGQFKMGHYNYEGMDIPCIQFKLGYMQDNPHLLSIYLTLDEYIKSKKDPNQTKLDGFFKKKKAIE